MLRESLLLGLEPDLEQEAKRFGVSRRTIYRDLNRLRASLHDQSTIRGLRFGSPELNFKAIEVATLLAILQHGILFDQYSTYGIIWQHARLRFAGCVCYNSESFRSEVMAHLDNILAQTCPIHDTNAVTYLESHPQVLPQKSS
jgi:hypothetical protein